MNRRSARTLSGLLIAVFIVTACSSGRDSGAGPINNSGVPVTGEGICANTYFPVREGATWTYRSEGSPSGDYTFTDTITSVREDGFTLTSESDDFTRTQEWACKEEGLTALQLGGIPLSALSSQDIDLEIEVKNVSGAALPAELSPGSQWQHMLDFEGNMEIAGETATAEGNVQTNFNAVGSENVTVPAGTFEAMKVQVVTALNISMKIQGLTVPVAFSGTYDYWYAQGVGWVKASGSGNVTGIAYDETIELQSYNIP